MPLASRPHTPKARIIKSDKRRNTVTVLDTTTPDAFSKDDIFTAARKAMVDSQLRTSGVTAQCAVGPMGRVPRENFVPDAARDVAYMDRAVPLGDGKYLAAPLVHGKMVQEAAPQTSDHVIVVDGGSGYLPALLKDQVASLSVLTPQQALTSTKGKHVANLIMIDGAIEQFPDALVKHLADDGRVVTGLIDNGVTSVARGRKSGGTIAFLKLGEMGVPRLPAFNTPKGWSF
jgi:protein-L-isoaspartate(D-aspartate) O-methyltransferase